MDMSQNEVSVFGSKIATEKGEKRTPHFETFPYGSFHKWGYPKTDGS